MFSLYESCRGVTPVVLFHGLNSTCCEGKTLSLSNQIKDALPTIYIHSIRFGKDATDDRLRTLFDDLDRQVTELCRMLKEDDRLQGGFNAIGLSQGGLILRGYVERCNDPPVKTLITLGTPHAGISELPSCSQPLMKTFTKELVDVISFARKLPKRLACHFWQGIVVGQAYSCILQRLIIPAQYFRDTHRLDEYQDARPFIANINNEFTPRNETYARNMENLTRLVLYRFTEDTLVIPAQSEWFLYPKYEKLEESPLITENWLGLETLLSSGRMLLKELPGEHLNISDTLVKDELLQYL